MARKPLTISVGPGSMAGAQDVTRLPMSPTFAQRVSQAKAKKDAGQAEDVTATSRDRGHSSASLHLSSTQPASDTLPNPTTGSFLLSPSPTAKQPTHLDELPSIPAVPRSRSASQPHEKEAKATATIRQIYEPHPGRRVDEADPHPGRRVGETDPRPGRRMDEPDPHPGRRIDEIDPHPGRRVDETDSSLRSHSEGRSASPDVNSLKSGTPELVVQQGEPKPLTGGQLQQQRTLTSPASPSTESPQLPAQRPMPAFALLGANPNPNQQREGPARRNRLRPRTPFVNFLNRTRSVRTDTGEGTGMTPRTTGHTPTLSEVEAGPSHHQPIEDPSLKTAPLPEGDRSFREMMASSIRNRSADRQQSTPASENGSTASGRDQHKQHGAFSSSSIKENTGSMFSSLKSSSSKAADGLGKAGKGFFGKLGRSGSNGEKEAPTFDGNYELSVIKLPLVQQTRLTRLSKRLEDSRDKTEFWMPALPWRCIDYLNFKGCEEEGLYRIPGSQSKVMHWQRRFDTELDINLFDEPDLYDINIIGSMFKAWLRDLPDELLPKSTQIRIENECRGATEAPQMLKDELSKLPPYNYYLLFAITCHLSLLHSYVDQNKMDFRNLCICFQPCLGVEMFCFYFLVCDWKHCWQGCWTEKEALAAEYRFLDGLDPLPPSMSNARNMNGNINNNNNNNNSSTMMSSREMIDERAVSSSESSKPPSFRHATGSAPPAPVEVDLVPKPLMPTGPTTISPPPPPPRGGVENSTTNQSSSMLGAIARGVEQASTMPGTMSSRGVIENSKKPLVPKAPMMPVIVTAQTNDKEDNDHHNEHHLSITMATNTGISRDNNHKEEEHEERELEGQEEDQQEGTTTTATETPRQRQELKALSPLVPLSPLHI
ncbi:MAG: hypothetical protein M1823_002571 [Watsoniomyces obsoletus]|nr:MAG: hypothetical protein M1823_002571 [Watsoniomyces obsoletus]